MTGVNCQPSRFWNCSQDVTRLRRSIASRTVDGPVSAFASPPPVTGDEAPSNRKMLTVKPAAATTRGSTFFSSLGVFDKTNFATSNCSVGGSGISLYIVG